MDKITELFIEDPEREFHIREIARLVKSSPTTVSKYVKRLSRMKIIIEEKIEIGHMSRIDDMKLPGFRGASRIFQIIKEACYDKEQA